MLKKKGEGDECELKSAQKLIQEQVVLDGKTVTADALHDQHKTAFSIIEKGGNYLLQVKGNQGNLLNMIENAFASMPPRYGPAKKAHGRIEQRAIEIIGTNVMQIGFPHARSIVAIWLFL